MKPEVMRKFAAHGGQPFAVAIRALLLLTVLLTSPCQAQSEVCANAQSNAEMRACADSHYQTAQARLAAVLSRLETRLPVARRRQLAAAQSAWRGYANAESSFQAGAAGGGNLAPLIRTETLAELTESRALMLERGLKELEP